MTGFNMLFLCCFFNISSSKNRGFWHVHQCDVSFTMYPKQVGWSSCRISLLLVKIILLETIIYTLCWQKCLTILTFSNGCTGFLQGLRFLHLFFSQLLIRFGATDSSLYFPMASGIDETCFWTPMITTCPAFLDLPCSSRGYTSTHPTRCGTGGSI